MKKNILKLFLGLVLSLFPTLTSTGCVSNSDEIIRFDGYYFLEKSLQSAIKSKFRITPQRLQAIKNNSADQKNILVKDLEKFIINELQQIFKLSLPEITNISNRFNLLTNSQAISISEFKVYPSNDELSVLITIYGAKINDSNTNFSGTLQIDAITSFIANINIIKNLANAIEELQLIYVEIIDTDDEEKIANIIKNKVISKLMEITNLEKDEIKIRVTRSNDSTLNSIFYIISSEKINLEFPEKKILVIFKKKLTLEGFILNRKNQFFYETKIINNVNELDELKQEINKKIQDLALSYFYELLIEIDLSMVNIDLVNKSGEDEVDINIIYPNPETSKIIKFRLIVKNL